MKRTLEMRTTRRTAKQWKLRAAFACAVVLYVVGATMMVVGVMSWVESLVVLANQ